MKEICSKITLLAALVIYIIPLKADEGFIVGATTATGVMYATEENPNISMNREIINFHGFRQFYDKQLKPNPVAGYTVLFEFENHSSDYQLVPVAFPIDLYFTHYDTRNRNVILNFLQKTFPQYFDLKGSQAEILAKMQKVFEHRNFIRHFINVRDLENLNIRFSVKQDGKVVEVEKALAEFRLINDGDQKDAVLYMQLHLLHNLSFNPKKKSEVVVNYTTPAFNKGYDDWNFYAPYVLGTGKTWRGEIGEIYIVNDVLRSNLMLPYYVKFEAMDYDFDKRVTIIRDHEPETTEKIAFYSNQGNTCGCTRDDAFRDKAYIPAAISSIKASSWVKKDIKVKNACFEAARGNAIGGWVPDFDMARNERLALFDDTTYTEKLSKATFSGFVENDCDDGVAEMEIEEAYHPIWAFDLALDSVGIKGLQQPGHFNLASMWCENVQGSGVGQYVEFTITQPASEIKIYPGNQADAASYEKYNKIIDGELVQVDGNFRKTMTYSTLIPSSSYVLDLQPGTYRFYIRKTEQGKEDQSCISAILLRFDIRDGWFNAAFDRMQN